MTRTLSVSLLRTLFIIIGSVLFLLLILGVTTRIRCGKRLVSISGQVVESDTDKPVANARVIVTLLQCGFMYYEPSLGYAVVTDEAGERKGTQLFSGEE